MRYQKLAELYEALGLTTKRLEKTDILSKFLEEVSEEDSELMYLLLGDIYPSYNEKKIGISNQLAIQAISKSTGVDKEQVVKEWKRIGDIGKVAEELSKKKRQSTLHSQGVLITNKVLENLRKLPELEGKGTVGKKLALITEMLSQASHLEALYLIRTLIGDLRMGVQESTIRDAIAKAFFRGREDSKEVQEAIDKSNDLAKVFNAAKKGKLKELGKIELEVGKPIKAMLANKETNIEEGFKVVGSPAAVEYKYDGFRLIIHKKGNEVKLFTRKLENVSKQFPEVVEYINKYVKGKDFILDSEAVGFDSKTKEYRPFQEISQRIRRKYSIEEIREKLPVEVNIFDVLYHNGKSIMEEPFKKRSELVSKIIVNKPFKIIRAKQIITNNVEKAEEFYKKALADNQEGVMMKNLESPYQPGRRVGNMIKIKPEEKDLDLVITGAEYGAGKRGGWMSSFIISCYDEKTKKFLEIGKVGTGIKEKSELGVSFGELTDLLTPLITSEKGKSVKIKPKIVVSVTYQEIQRSPNYPSGFALRFPRVTALRPDRRANEINTLKEIEKDYEKQKRNYVYG